MDTLSEAIRHLRLKTNVFHRLRHCGRWSIESEFERKAMFHLVGEGQCEVIGARGERIRLDEGDAVLFMRPVDHRVVSVPAASKTQETLLLCGYFEFESALAPVLLHSLPNQIILRRREGVAARTSDAAASVLLQLIVNETAVPDAGSDALLDKLADALFIFATRHCLENGRLEAGLLGALVDRQLGAALEAMHAAPLNEWSIAQLAVRAAMSRAAFARRFRCVMGMSPGRYLASLRLHMGREALEEGATLARAAEQAGYATEASFSRAFKHAFGRSPGAVRRRQRIE